MTKKYLIIELEASYIKVLPAIQQGKYFEFDHHRFQIFDNKDFYKAGEIATFNKNIDKNIDNDSFWVSSTDSVMYNQVSLSNFITWLNQTHHDIDGVFINIPSKNFYIREMLFPFTDSKKIEQVVKNEIALLLPYPIENFITRYYTVTQDVEKTSLTLLNVDYNEIFSLLNEFKNANIRVEGIYAKPDVLVKTFLEKENSGLLSLNIGAESSILLYLFKKDVHYIRSIPLGYTRFIRKCLFASKLSLEQVRTLCTFVTLNNEKLDLKENPPYLKNKKNFLLDLELFLIQLVAEVNTSIRVLSQNEMDLTKIDAYITSDFFIDSFFYNFLKKRIALNVCPYLPESYYSLRSSFHGDFLLGNVIPSLQVNGNLNFLTPTLKKTMTVKKELGVWNVFSYSFLALGCIFFLSAMLIQYHTLKSKILKYEENNIVLFKKFFGSKPASQNNLLQEAQDFLSIKENKLIINKKYQDVSVSKLLEVVNNLVIELEDVFFTDFQLKIQTESLLLKGDTASYETFNHLKEILEGSEYFANLKPLKVRESAVKGLEKRVAFSLVLSLKKSDLK